MNKKTIIGLIAASLMSATAVANEGHWEWHEVCQYETNTTYSPYTYCSYNGNIFGSVGSTFYAKSADDSYSVNGHVTCPSTRYKSESGYVYDQQSGQYASVIYSGNLFLKTQLHGTNPVTTTTEIPGSCQMTRVWVLGPELPDPV